MADTIITPPKAQVPIGFVTVAGQRLEVMQHPEFIRFFFDLLRRIGGTSAPSIDGLEAAIAQAEADIDALTLDIEGLASVPLPPITQEAGDVSPVPLVMPVGQNEDGRLSALEAEFAVMRDQINGLMQGTAL